MKVVFVISLLCSMLVVCGCATMGFSSDRTVIQAKDRAAPALVHIRPVREVYTTGRREEILVQGSGFIISPDGYVVTNEHVAGQAKRVRCILHTREELEADVVGSDRYTDIAVLKLRTDKNNLPYVKMGRSSDLLAGQTVLALGSPHGLARSVSQGIISVADRYLGDGMSAPYNTWIQTDAAINPGNSGGPLVNLRGEVVGVNTRKLSGADNVGFAIPIDIARESVDAIIRDGRVRRSSMGITLQETMAMDDDPSHRGVVVADIDPLSPAAESGLRPGDFIVAVNDIPTNARFSEELPPVRKQIADLPVGEPVQVRVRRGSEEHEFVVVTQEMHDLIDGEQELVEWGFTVAEVSPELARQAQLPMRTGVLVLGAQQGSIADIAGLQMGDIILKMDGDDIPDVTAFIDVYQDRIAQNQVRVLLDVKRGPTTRYVLVKQQEGERNQDDT